MRRVYVVLTGLMLAAVVLQFYFAAVGAFAKPQVDTSYRLHDIDGGMVIPLLAILATVAAALLKLPGRQIGLTILPVGLVVVQFLIVLLGDALSTDNGDKTTPIALIILGLHAVNGLAVMAVAGTVFARARRVGAAGTLTVSSRSEIVR
jgi:hypothetical protein